MPAFKDSLLAAIGLLLLSNFLPLVQRAPAQAQDPGGGLAAQVKALTARVATLEAKTSPLSVAGTDLTVTGVNVHIVDGSGRTDDGALDAHDKPIGGRNFLGLGNLTVGYNGPNDSSSDNTRTGSHNLILGGHNNYSSCGGIIAGTYNIISGPYDSITAGSSNVAGGLYSSVSGGEVNTASSDSSAVSGGYDNTAGGGYASVSGGSRNTAAGDFSAIGGGRGRIRGARRGWSAGAPVVKSAPARRTGKTKTRKTGG